MGCVTSAEGISPTEDKVEAIKKAPRPENCTQLRAFLGMINYRGKFIRNLSSILQPLNQLLQKDREFLWSPRCQEAFNKAKESLSSSHVLVHYNPSLPVILESDASQYGIGAVILHRFPNGDERPIAYASRSLNSSEKNYSQIEKEGLVIIFGVTKYYMYPFGRKFKLRTDHQPLLKIFAPDSATPVLAAARLQRWSLLLSSYQYEIEFKPSAKVASSDALSRLPLQYRQDASVEDKIFQVPVVQLRKHPVSVLEIARQTARNPVLAKALAMTQNGWPAHFCTTPELKPFFLRKDELSVEQGKMKMHHDKHAKFREIAVCDIVLARDHLSGQKWQPGTVVQHPSSHSCRVHLDDGRVWRRHVDDILQNNSHSKTAESGVPSSETATPVVPEPQPVISPEISSHQPDNSAQLETTPASTSPVLRRSSRSHRPPQRLIEEM